MATADTAAAAVHHAATRALRRFDNVPAAVREELVQDAVIRTVYTVGVRDPARYAARVARRLAIDWLRRRSEVPLGEPADIQEPNPWERRMELVFELRRLHELIAAAPPTHQETLRVLFVEDTSLAEVVDQRVAPGADPAVVRDRWYKRRRRALSWIQAA